MVALLSRNLKPVVVGAVAFIAACATRPARETPVPQIQYLFPSMGAAAVGDSIPLEAMVCAGDQCVHDPTLTGETSAPDVVRISATGFVHALAQGEAAITLTAAGVAPVTFRLAVVPRPHKLVIDPASITVAVGDTVRLTARGVDSSGAVTSVVPVVLWFDGRGLDRLQNSSGTLVARAIKTGRFEVSARMFEREATATVRVRDRAK